MFLQRMIVFQYIISLDEVIIQWDKQVHVNIYEII